jgi:phosphoserine phosphatase RsbU/P
VPDLLGDVVRSTAGAADSAEALDRVARLLTRRADWVIADRLDEPDLVVRVAAYDGSGPLALPQGMGRAAARRSAARAVGMLPAVSGAPRRLLRLGRDDLDALTRSAEPHVVVQAATALALGTIDLLLLGLVAGDSLVGVLTMGSRTGFSEDDLVELPDVGLHLGLVLEADRLRAAQRAIATALQTSLLPALPAVPGLRLAARYRPAARGLRVGGDWYDAFRPGSGLVVVIGDASGHDVSAAVRMSDLRNLLRAHAVDHDEPPSAVMARMDRSAATLGLDATATCLMARLEPRPDGTWRAEWTSAGHPPPIHLRAGRAELLETDPDLMLGVDPCAHRTDHERDLLPGDTLLLYTDGLVEVPRESLGDRLELLRRVVEQHAGTHPDHLLEGLLDAFGHGAGDDIALLALDVLPVRRGSARPAAPAAS